MTTKEQTCEERINGYLANLEESVTDILKGYYGEREGKGEDQDNARGFEEWNNFPLSVETRKETKILLSWGGPSDFLSVVHDGTDIFTVTYHFQDWFDGASRNIDGDSKIWEYAQTVIEAREECGY
jgi:hypothetical protein